MADFLTECPGSSDFPDEEVKWKPVDASEPELEKAMATLSTKPKEEKAEPSPTSPVPLDKMEPDFSAPDKAPDADVIVDDSGSKDPLPSSTTSLPSTGLPSTQSVPKSTPVVKSAPKAPPSRAQAELEKLKPFLRFNDGADSDAAPSLPARSSTSVPKKPALKPRSKSRSRAQTPSRDRSRSRLSPERDDFHRKKPVGSLPSSHFTGFTQHDVYPKAVYQLDPMPTDTSMPAWKDEFLAWTLRDLRKSWRAGERAWVNLHIALYLYDPTYKYPIAHPRAFAACSVAGDAALPERYCCWSCQNMTSSGTAKSLWPDMCSFTFHWHQVHASQLNDEWTDLALYNGVTIDDLSWALLGLDLQDSPLPRARDALKTIPKVMPAKRDGHNEKIYGSPWFVHRPIAPLRRALPMPHPPSYPPPRHVLGSLNSRDCDLVAVNKAVLPSSPPVARSTKSTVVDGVTSKSSSLAGPSGASSGSAASSDLPPLQVLPAVVNSNGSRFHDGPLAKGFCRIGWENPLSLWRSQLQDEVKSFIFPASDVQVYSNLREQWHLMFCQRSPMFYWLLQMEEHSFYLFLIKVMATRSIRARSSLSLEDREKSLAMASVCTDDLRAELQFYKSFKHDDSQMPYVASVLEHVRSVVSLHMPLDKDFTFPLAPSWNTPPVDDKWQRSYYRSLTNKR